MSDPATTNLDPLARLEDAIRAMEHAPLLEKGDAAGAALIALLAVLRDHDSRLAAVEPGHNQ